MPGIRNAANTKQYDCEFFNHYYYDHYYYIEIISITYNNGQDSKMHFYFAEIID